jgi:Flp pilus assembly pilin Flp
MIRGRLNKRRKSMRKMKKMFLKAFAGKADDRGIGVIEVLLILVVIIGLVLVFKNQIGAIITSAFNAINGNVDTIIN